MCVDSDIHRQCGWIIGWYYCVMHCGYLTSGSVKIMGVIKARIQTVEDIYQLVWTAVASRRPMSAIYKERPRLLCPHRLGRNQADQLRVLCYQYGGESESGLAPLGSPDNWRCIALEKLRAVKLLEGSWKTAPNHSRPATCVVKADIDAEDQPARDPQKGH